MASETPRQKRITGRVMHEFKHGQLKSGRSGKGGKVKSRKQAIAIGLSEARKAGAKIPRKKKTLTVPLEFTMYRQIEALAAQRGITVADLISSWVREKALAESTAK